MIYWVRHYYSSVYTERLRWRDIYLQGLLSITTCRYDFVSSSLGIVPSLGLILVVRVRIPTDWLAMVFLRRCFELSECSDVALKIELIFLKVVEDHSAPLILLIVIHKPLLNLLIQIPISIHHHILIVQLFIFLNQLGYSGFITLHLISYTYYCSL